MPETFHYLLTLDSSVLDRGRDARQPTISARAAHEDELIPTAKPLRSLRTRTRRFRGYTLKIGQNQRRTISQRSRKARKSVTARIVSLLLATPNSHEFGENRTVDARRRQPNRRTQLKPRHQHRILRTPATESRRNLRSHPILTGAASTGVWIQATGPASVRGSAAKRSASSF